MTDLTGDEEVTLIRPLVLAERPPMLEALHRVSKLFEDYARMPAVSELVTELMAPLAVALLLLSSVLCCTMACVFL